MPVISYFFLGLSFGFGPCLGSCGPLLIAYISGTEKNTAKSVATYILFSLSRISAYFVIGLLFFFLGELIIAKLFGNLSRYIFILGGGFIVFVGILMALGKKMEFGFCKFLSKNILERDKKSIMMFGFIIGFLPCAPLFAVFSSAVLMAKPLSLFLLYICFFGIGTFFSPLLVLAIFAGLIPRLLNRNLIITRIFNSVCGLIMVILGIQLITKAL